jgi:hypothetical protein
VVSSIPDHFTMEVVHNKAIDHLNSITIKVMANNHMLASYLLNYYSFYIN